jgi:type IX secretion system PorP/SprF family membrane protein
MRSINKFKLTTGIITILLITFGIKDSKAQLTGFHSAYFENEYLSNPAMAGLTKGLNLNLGYQKQWNTVPGGPKLQNLTADYNSGNRVGLGINVNADQAGLISRTRAMATFAYHIPVSESGKLNFGLSLGISDTYIDYSKIVGDQSDGEASAFNERRLYVDGDFGTSYTNGSLTLQAAIPNLKSVFFSDQNQNLEVDRSTFFTAAGYKIAIDNQYNNFTIEPKVVYRGVKGFDNIVDAGLNLGMTNYNFNISGMYHSNKTLTAAIGLNLQATDLIFAYTYNTGPLQTYANNTFEFGVKLKLFR